MAEFARFCANSVIATFALVAKLCEFHICNIFAPGKFGANSIFHPVPSDTTVPRQGVRVELSEHGYNRMPVYKEHDCCPG